MLKRTISGAVFVAIVATFFILREFVCEKAFNVFTYFLCAVGTFEMARAVKDRLLKGIFTCAVIFGGLLFPNYAVIQYWLLTGYGYLFTLGVVAIAVIAVTVYALIKKQTFKGLLYNLSPFVYPSLLLLTMLITNDIAGKEGFVAMLLIFVIAPLTDTMAYLVGSTIGGKKLCPRLSPKKTWSGAIGGLVGGIIGGIVIYFIFGQDLILNCFSSIALFIIIGLLGSILTQIGDLFESFIKRKVGIKDMGKIMPGHGGVLDRIDGTMFVSLLVMITFLIV